MVPPSSFLTDSLRIATEHYYWKPGKALFHAVQVEEYARTGVCFEHPVMDLGCGDGILGLLEVVWVILGVERVEYTHYCRLSCIPRGR
jgi:hypothetical protein